MATPSTATAEAALKGSGAERAALSGERSGSEANQALVPAGAGEEGAGGRGSVIAGPALRLPVELDVSVPVRDFRVRNLLALEPGSLIESQWGHGGDVPLAAGEVQLAWSEFEVVESVLAVRITRLA